MVQVHSDVLFLPRWTNWQSRLVQVQDMLWVQVPPGVRFLGDWQRGLLHTLGKREGVTAPEVRILYLPIYEDTAEWSATCFEPRWAPNGVEFDSSILGLWRHNLTGKVPASKAEATGHARVRDHNLLPPLKIVIFEKLVIVLELVDNGDLNPRYW